MFAANEQQEARIYYPPAWDKNSIKWAHKLGLSQAEVNAAEVNLARFRRSRDEMAVERMRTEYNDLKKRETLKYHQLQRLLNIKKQLLKADDPSAHTLKRVDGLVREVGGEWAYLDVRIAAIEHDFPIRQARLSGGDE